MARHAIDDERWDSQRRVWVHVDGPIRFYHFIRPTRLRTDGATWLWPVSHRGVK